MTYPTFDHLGCFKRPPDAHDQILRDLSFLDLRNYAKINKAAYRAVKSFYQRAFQPEKVLRPFFSLEEIRRLRILQLTIGFLISGSTALSFFERTTYPEADLDLYVDIRYCIFAVEFLIRIGYRYEPFKTERMDQPSDVFDALEEVIARFEAGDWNGFESLYPGNDIATVFSFERDNKKVQIIACQASPLSAILAFHSSTCFIQGFIAWSSAAFESVAVVMNLISYSHAISLYPRSTFIDRTSLQMRPVDFSNPDSTELARRKYTQRGWRMIRAITAAKSLRSDTHMFHRHVGDRWCWTVPLLPVSSDEFVQGELALGRPEMILMHSWKLDFDSTWSDVSVEKRGFWVPASDLKQKYCFSEETLAEVREIVGFDDDLENITEGAFHKIITRRHAERSEPGHSDNVLRLMLLDIFESADAKYQGLPFQNRHKAYAAQLLAEVFQPLLQIFGDQLQIPDEESRLLPDAIPREDLESPIVITVENDNRRAVQESEDMKERMRERFSGIVRAKEGKMVNVSSYIAFHLYDGSRPSSSASRSMSRSRNPHANVITPASAVLPAQSDVIVQADAGGRSSSQVPPLRHGQADLTYPSSSNFHSNNPHPPLTNRTNSNSDISAILAARRPSLAPSESDAGVSSPSLRAPGLNARLVGVSSSNSSARRGRPKTKLGGYGGSSSSLSLGGSSRDGDGAHEVHFARIPHPVPAPSSSLVDPTHPLPPQPSPVDVDTPLTPTPRPPRRRSENGGQLPNFAIRNPGNITIGWDDE
ncbi:hypothetical protein V5O48_013821 [Marasmius crinis-equi]|uniref:F-box domain-containing protein n=1 Tax=Marasmius crinis-equi TaxID=585013 RepID=A0ABR3EZ08_9AGAR